MIFAGTTSGAMISYLSAYSFLCYPILAFLEILSK